MAHDLVGRSLTRSMAESIIGLALTRGRRLARLLDQEIDAEVERRGEGATRGEVIGEMGEAAGISATTVEGILAADIDCPPLDRLEGFARVLAVTLDALVEAGNADGCAYGEEGDDEEARGADENDERDIIPGQPDDVRGTEEERRAAEGLRRQISARGGSEGMRRAAEIRMVHAEERAVDLAFSSTQPVDRFFGIEVLSHERSAVRLARLLDGAALLHNHDWDRQIGVVESARIDRDGRGRARVRFGRGAQAEEIWRDVLDGVRRHVSVGYTIHGVRVEKREGEPDLVTVTDWEPFEISIVSVPADTQVGIGRAAAKAPEDRAAPRVDPAGQMQTARGSDMEKVLRNDKGDLVRAKVDKDGKITEVLEVIERAGEAQAAAASRAREEERQRVSRLQEMGRTYDAPAELIEQHVRDGSAPETLQGALLEHLANRGRQQTNVPANASIGLTDAETRQYSLFRAIRAQIPGASRAEIEAASFERECSEAAAQHYGRQARGFLVPHEVLTRAFNTGGAPNVPAGSQSGGNIVATTLLAQSFIDMLRNRTTIMQLGQPMTGLVGNVEIPKQTGGSGHYWLGEGEDAGEGVPTIGQIALTPRTIAAFTDLSRKLIIQSTPDAEGLVRRDLAAALALGIDLAGYYGSGADNQPRGIASTGGINAVDFGTDGAGAGTGQMPTWEEIVQLETEIAADNADVANMAYVVNATMRGHLKTTQKFAGTSGAPIWETNGTVNGYRAEVTNQIINGDVIFGNFADLIVGVWGGLDITVDPYSLSRSGGVRIVMFQDVDFVVRRPESFALGRDATA